MVTNFQENPFCIRQARLTDVTDIVRILITTRRTSNRGQLPETYLANLSHEKYETEYREALLCPVENQITLIAQLENGSLVGFLNGKPTVDAPEPNSIEMKELYVEGAFQRRGAGEALIARFMADALRKKTRKVYVWVLSGNTSARCFYKKLGATHVQDTERLIGDKTCQLSIYLWNEGAMRRIARSINLE